MSRPTKGLRFAPLIRVSTPEQADKKHSLGIQVEHIREYVHIMGGVIAKDCWRYTGQEHATPEYERVKFDQLLEDCTKNKFDAVIVYDATRWSRDILKHAKAIQIFKQNHIGFYIGMIEQNLFDPNYETSLGIQVLLAQHQAYYQKQRSIIGKIKAANKINHRPANCPMGASGTVALGMVIFCQRTRANKAGLLIEKH
jgi:site-specific DNA recombinase